MRPARDEANEFCGVKYRIDSSHVGKMRATKIWIIQQNQVVRLPDESFDDVRHGVSHAAEVHGDVCRLAKQSTVQIKHRAGIVEPVFDVRRECRTPQHYPHLVANCLHATLKQRQFDAVDA